MKARDANGRWMSQRRPPPKAQAKANGNGQAAPERPEKPLFNLDTGAAMRAKAAPAWDQPKQNPFAIYEMPSSVFPKDKKQKLAMDDAIQWASTATFDNSVALSAMYDYGVGFVGYPTLSVLAQIPEYRNLSEVMATEMTRKWIRIHSRSDETREKEALGKVKEAAGKPDEQPDEGETETPAEADAREAEDFAPNDLDDIDLNDIDPELDKEDGDEGDEDTEGELDQALLQYAAERGKTDESIANGSNEKADKIKKLNDAFDRLKVRDVFAQVALNDGFFGRAHIYIDVDMGEGITIGSPEAKEEMLIPIGNGKHEISKQKVNPQHPIKRLVSVEPVWAYPANYDASNPLAENFYDPVTWYVQQQEVDKTRFLTFVARPVPDLLKPAFAFGGLSLTQMARPTVENWLKTRRSVGAIISAFSVFVLATNLNQELQANGSDFLLKRAIHFNATRDNQGLMITDKELEDFQNISAPLSTLDVLQAQSQEHMSLPAGTKITTLRGEVPIEAIRNTDYVLTRAGFAPVKWAGITGTSDALVEIEAAGHVLRATGNHPVWLESTNAFVNAENVSLSDRLLAVGTASQENMASLSRGVVAGGGAPSAAIIAMKKAAAFFTASCGKHITARFQRAMKCITQMVMAPITVGTTWNLSPASNTKLGTMATQRSASPSVDFAEMSSHRLRAAQCGTVVGAEAVSIERVSAVNVPRQLVYDIIVENDWPPEFFANGILVHNCSVSRIPIVKLLGVQPAGLNADSEGIIRMFYDTIGAQQERFFRPNLQTIFWLVQLSEFGEIDDDITFSFEPLWELDELQKATKRKTDADAAGAYINAGVLDPEEVRQAVADEPDSPYANIDPSAVPEPPEPELPPGFGGGGGGFGGPPKPPGAGPAGAQPPAGGGKPPGNKPPSKAQ